MPRRSTLPRRVGHETGDGRPARPLAIALLMKRFGRRAAGTRGRDRARHLAWWSVPELHRA